MAVLNKVEIPTALPGSSHLDLSCDHVTTMNFGEMQPVHYRHMIKGEHINLSGTGVVRPFPMAAPTFGRMRCNINHFFVPFRTIFPQWESFYNDTIGVNMDSSSLIDSSPVVPNNEIVNFFLGSSGLYATFLSNWQSGDPYDFSNGDSHYRFTSLGKLFFKIFTSLGYAIVWDAKDTSLYSALPILAYCRIYFDWYANQNYLDSNAIIQIRKMFAYNDPTSPLIVKENLLGYLLDVIRHVQYDQDYFVGAWDNPFAPNGGQYSAISFADIVKFGNSAGGVSPGAYIQLGEDPADPEHGTPYMNENVPNYLGSQYLHDALKVITDYSKRHQLAGASNINRVLAQYGFGVKNMQVDRSIHIGGTTIDIETGAVFSTANTAAANEPSTLGDFAGRGFAQGSSAFDFQCDEMGIQLSIASILPSGGMFQGMDENNMHIQKLQFFTPEFDGLGVQVIRKREVYTSINSSFNSNAADYDKAFGFTGRYGEYKRPRSWVSGDFRVPTRWDGASAWHLMREFDDASFNGNVNNVVHSLAFTRYNDADQYRRIFTYTGGDNDPFYAEFHFAVSSFAPCHGLFETYEFEKGSNKKVSVENGAILN